MARTLADTIEALAHKAAGHNAFKYASVYYWVFENGLCFDSSPLTRCEWEIVKRFCLFLDKHACFANCQRTVLLPHLGQLEQMALGKIGLISPFSYVEGFVSTKDAPIPLLHSWLLLNGKVVDPTLRLESPRKRKVLPELAMGVFPATREYYGAVIPWRQVAECVCASRAWQSVIDDPVRNFPLLQAD